MQQIIQQFALEYTSKDSLTQDTALDPAGNSAAFSEQNPVLSKLLMADQDSPLDLTVRKPDVESSQQDGVLDLSTKKKWNHSSISLKTAQDTSVISSVRQNSIITNQNYKDDDDDDYDYVNDDDDDNDDNDDDDDDDDGLPLHGLQVGIQENNTGTSPVKLPLASSLLIKEELVSQKHHLLAQPFSFSLEKVRLLKPHKSDYFLSRNASREKPHLDNLITSKQVSSYLGNLKKLPVLLENHMFTKDTNASHNQSLNISAITVKKEAGNSPPVDLKIPQVKGMDLSWNSINNTSDLYSYSCLNVSSVHSENLLSRRLRAILPKQTRRAGLASLHGKSVMGEYWGLDVEQSKSVPQYHTSDPEADPAASKQPRKKRGRYRQYNSEILEEAIAVVMSGKMSVSKAQNIYGIPHSTLEYKVKERLGTLKNPPKKKIKLMMRMEEQKSEMMKETESTPTTAATSSTVQVDILQELADIKEFHINPAQCITK